MSRSPTPLSRYVTRCSSTRQVLCLISFASLLLVSCTDSKKSSAIRTVTPPPAAGVEELAPETTPEVEEETTPVDAPDETARTKARPKTSPLEDQLEAAKPLSEQDVEEFIVLQKALRALDQKGQARVKVAPAAATGEIGSETTSEDVLTWDAHGFSETRFSRVDTQVKRALMALRIEEDKEGVKKEQVKRLNSMTRLLRSSNRKEMTKKFDAAQDEQLAKFYCPEEHKEIVRKYKKELDSVLKR